MGQVPDLTFGVTCITCLPVRQAAANAAAMLRMMQRSTELPMSAVAASNTFVEYRIKRAAQLC